MRNGWIKLHRKITESPIFNDHKLFRLWIICLTQASHQERKQLIGRQTIDLLPGEFVTGRHAIFELYNRGLPPSEIVKGEKTVYRWLELLEEGEFLTIKKTNKYSVVSINNWSLYQENDQQKTNKRPSNDHQMTTNKNVKNVKNDKKKDSSPKRVYDETSDFYKLAALLHDKMKANNENVKPANLQKWSDEIRVMIERDNRNVEQVKYLIEWSQADSFWHTNILSPSALRRNFDKMVLQVKSSKQSSGKVQNSPPQYKDLGGREY